MRRMLIVEDERDLCDCLEQFFRSRGFNVTSAYSGEEALTQLTAITPDVILLDILLPGVSGLEVLRRVKHIVPSSRVVMVTALDLVDLKAEARLFGASAYVTKPFDSSDATWSAVFAEPA